MRRGQDLQGVDIEAIEAQLAAAVVYSPDCDCGSPRLEMFVHHAKTDAEAARVFLERKELWLNRDERGEARCDGPRYWIVHGPGGHVIAVRAPG